MRRLQRLKSIFQWFCIFSFVWFNFATLVMGQSLEEARKLNNQADQLYRSGRYAEAIPLAQQALAIDEKALGLEHPKVATSLNNLAMLYRNLRDYGKAEKLFRDSLAIYEKTLGPEHPNVAISLYNLALVYHELAHYTRAEPLYERSLAIREKRFGPEHPNVAKTLNALALFYCDLGNYTLAKQLAMRSFEIREKVLGSEHFDVAESLNSLASVYFELGDYSKVEPLLRRTLAICEKTLGSEHPDLATNLNNLAELYRNLGDYSRAEHLYMRAIAISEKTLGSEHPSVGACLNNLAVLYKDFGDYAEAELTNKRSLAIREKALGPEHPDVAESLNNLAALYLALGRYDEALASFNKTDNDMGLGTYYLGVGNYKAAQKLFRALLDALQNVGMKLWLITTHVGLAFSHEGLGDLSRARDHFQQAIDLIEEQWQSLAPSARRTFLDGKVGANFSRLDAYEGMVRIILKEKRSGYQKESLLYAERVKSRGLLEMLAARGATGNKELDSKVLAKDRQFQQDIAMMKRQVSILIDLGSKAPEGDKERVEKTLNKTLQDYETFINEVKLQDKELASLITVEATPIEKIQSLLDPSITMVEYFTTKDITYAWLITRDDIKVQEIPLGKDKLTAMVNDLLLPNISNRTRRPAPLITLSTGGTKEAASEDRDKNRQQFLKGTQDLYASLLQSLEKDIASKNLIVVPHGVLHKVPFAALNDGKGFVVDRYALSQVPSSSVVEYVVNKRKEDQGRLLAFANPETDYVPLGFAEIEVKQISSLFSKKDLFFRGEATEGRAKQKSSGPSVIHFACHGEFNDRQPMQSGLLLSKDADNDGVLQVHEIFGMDLRNANLVVLSACDTARSKIQGGDDLVGLSRGFIYAGAPSILATLWEVDDNSTAILMKAFYENWRKKGVSKPEALRAAQMSLKAMPQYEHPFYWAPFIMIGDWK
jgi:CHAT domain-containing protein/Tfp pilus assembly protein PilF